MTDLSDAVDALAEPVIEHVAQIGDDGKWLRAHTTVHPPLLRQLADRVRPSGVPDGAGGKSSPAERSVADLNALLEYAKITTAIRSWCHKRKVKVTRPPHVDPVADLIRWRGSVEFDTPLADDGWHVRQLTKWVAVIETILNPRQAFEADYPCPICHATSWGNAIDGGSTRAIVIMYQVDDKGHLFDERALCRPCQTVWDGHASVMELAEEQHETA